MLMRRATAVTLIAPAASRWPRWTLALRPNTGAGRLWRTTLRLRPSRRSRRSLALRLTLLLGRAWLLRRALLFARRPLAALGPGRNCRQRYSAARLIDIDHPHFDDIADADDFVRIANEAVGQSADVHQAAVGQADIDEHAEIDDVEHRARQLHARRQILQLYDAPSKDGRGQTVARIERRPGERSQNILEQVRADVELCGKLLHIDITCPLGDEAAGAWGGRGVSFD